MISGPATVNRRAARRPSLSVTEASFDRRNSMNFLTGIPYGGPKISQQTSWNPKDATADKSKSQAKNIIDGKSLYSIRKENIASRDMTFNNKTPASKDIPINTNVEHLIEKNYIINSNLSNATPEKFPKVILNRFHRVSGNPGAMAYGMPRPPTRDKFQEVVEGIKREPSIVQIAKFPSLQEPVHCSTFDEFCEILGPSACQNCIENTNRHIGEQLQDMVFPTIDITTKKLIAPILNKLLVDGHKRQVRRRRLRELGYDQTPQLNMLSRSESHLSNSTCMRCNKPLVKKLKVSGYHKKMTSDRLLASQSMRFS
ncbi:hypothetical protein ACF0H5_007175 [Mactra antiquata]